MFPVREHNTNKLNKINNNNIIYIVKKRKIMKKDLLIKLAKMVLNLSEITINDKTWYIDGELTVGSEITDENGVVIEDGEYVVDEKKITVVEGKVTEIETIKDEETPEQEDVKIEVENAEETETEQPVEKDEKDLRIEELEGLLKDRDAIIEELNQKIAELEDKVKQPVEEPVKMNKVEQEPATKSNPALKYFQN